MLFEIGGQENAEVWHEGRRVGRVRRIDTDSGDILRFEWHPIVAHGESWGTAIVQRRGTFTVQRLVQPTTAGALWKIELDRLDWDPQPWRDMWIDVTTIGAAHIGLMHQGKRLGSIYGLHTGSCSIFKWDKDKDPNTVHPGQCRIVSIELDNGRTRIEIDDLVWKGKPVKLGVTQSAWESLLVPAVV